jgi:hypothetical protein
MEAGMLSPIRFLLMALVVLLSWSGRPVHAWEGSANQAIAADAVRMLPEPLRAHLQGVLAPVLATGLLEPTYKRVDSHDLHLSAIRGTAPDGGGAHLALERFALKAEAMLKTDEPFREIVFVLGQAAHFIHDMNNPLHTAWGETDEEHSAYESEAYFRDWPGARHGYRGFHLVKSYRCFAFESARRSHAWAGRALWTRSRQIIEDTWDHAVNDTINLWLSIVYRALGPDRSRERYGIPAPLGEIGREGSC